MAGDNQDDSVEQPDAVETQDTPEVEPADAPEVSGATKPTAEKPEFSDPNMQAKFTQRMQELSEKQKEFDAHKQKLEAYEWISSQPELVKAIKDHHARSTGELKEDTDVSDEEFTQASLDKSSFQKLVDKRAEAAAERKYGSVIKELRQGFTSIKSEQAISDFANSTDTQGNKAYPDFWKLDEEGKIEPILRALDGSKMSIQKKLEMAYREASYPSLRENALRAAHKTVDVKRQAIGEKGTTVEAKKDLSKLSLQEYAQYVIRKNPDLGFTEVP